MDSSLQSSEALKERSIASIDYVVGLRNVEWKRGRTVDMLFNRCQIRNENNDYEKLEPI
jgi:hypothetical protein